MLEWRKLGEVISVHTGSQLNRNDMLEQGAYPVINGGRTPSGYTIEPNEKSESITISQGGESAGFVNWMDCAFWAGAHCYVVDFLCDVSKRYLYHFLKNSEHVLMASKQGAGIPGLNRKSLYKLAIPIPSMAEQTRIVGILDTFTASIENLKQQITQRRKQYEHYRDQLLNLEGKEGVEMKRLSEVAELGTGSSNTNEELSMGKYPFFVRSQAVRYKDEYEFDETAIITSGDGVGVGKIFHFVEGKYALHQRAYRIHLVKDGIVPKFFYYYFACHFYDYIQKNAFNSSVTSVRKPMLQKFPTPIIDKETQLSIVSVLETFEASIANLEQQLAQRERQYEYYRNKLLTFE